MRSFKSMVTGILLAAFTLEPLLAQETMTLKEGFNVRMQPGLNGAIHHENPREQTVTVVERGNEWALVMFTDGKRYWVHSSGLEEYNNDVAPDNPGNHSSDGGRSFLALRDGSPIRSRPGTKTAGSAVIDYVQDHQPLILLGSQKDSDGDTWYKVKYVDSSGRELVGFIYEGKVRAMSDAETEACATCVLAAGSDDQGFIFNQAQQIEAVASQDAKGFHLGVNYHARCNDFITENGLGKWGRHMVAAAQKIAPDCFYNSNVFNNVCPGYKSMSQARKNTFIAILFASIAQVESTCRPGAQTQGTNDIADGLFQLEYSARQRRRAGRNERWCRTKEPVDSQSMTFQSECAVSIVEDTVCAWHSSITHGDGYWQKLRNERRITQILRNEVKRAGICN